MVRPIVLIPDPILKQPAHPVADAAAADVRALIADLHDTVREAHGVGLAANQIGSFLRVCVINDGPNAPFALINPEVTSRSAGTSVLEEGCLSIPDVIVAVSRPKKVTVRALDESGTSVEIRASDFFAKVLQHEIDHLNGVLITDYAKK